MTVAEKTADHDNVFFQRIQLYLIKLTTVAEKKQPIMTTSYFI